MATLVPVVLFGYLTLFRPHFTKQQFYHYASHFVYGGKPIAHGAAH